MNRFKVTELGSLGYGNPDAKIGFRQIVERNNIPLEVIQYSRELLRSRECMVKIKQYDDGCMDGRMTGTILLPFTTEDGVELREIDVASLDRLIDNSRPKVAGAGYLTGLSMQLALDPEVETLEEDLERLIDKFTEQGIYCGLHTADCHGDKSGCGCGASDKLREILLRGRELKDEINSTINGIFSMLGIEYSQGFADRADAGLIETLRHEDYFGKSNGQSRLELMKRKIIEVHDRRNLDNTKPLSVCKGLKGEHNEIFTVINTVEDYTFSQVEFTRRLKERFPGLPDSQIPNVFVVDIPRIEQLARATADGRDNEEEAFWISYYAGLSFQFATAAELTDGTLENYLVEEF